MIHHHHHLEYLLQALLVGLFFQSQDPLAKLRFRVDVV